ncbi:DUF1127 domain-containing protein [Methylorubrum populi]|uniref:DUF1127 domain-containing protein n=1 Tax=Methylorubrum TaxID=2282523 RepID=UPI001FEF93D6|nr:DUF1127 domain-containing protein [Methylorubrum populi]
MISDGAIEAHPMFSKVFESVRAHLRAKADEEALMSLSDAALDDIGLTRGAVSELRTGSDPVRPEAVRVAPLFAALAFPTALQGA